MYTSTRPEVPVEQRRIRAGEFNHFPARAGRLAEDHDVIVESHGRPTVVLLSYERYRRLTGSDLTPLDLIADEDVAEIDFEIPRWGERPTPADL
jgi:hypothetical protein